MNVSSRIILSASTACYLLSSPVSAMQNEELRSLTPRRATEVSVARLRHVAPDTSYQAMAPQIQARHPEDFTGQGSILSDVVTAYRQSRADYTGRVADAFATLHNPKLEPFAQQVEAFLRSYASAHPNHAFTQRLLREVQTRREDEDLSSSFLWTLPFRHAAERSTITDAEKDFFTNIVYPDLFFGMLENKGWRNHDSAYANLRSVAEASYSESLSSKGTEKIAERVDKLFPASAPYPCLGYGILGLSFLVENYLDQIFPIGFPMDRSYVHGVSLSPYGFAAHDRLHAEIDPREDELHRHVLQRGEDYFCKGGNVDDFIEVYPSIAVAKYNLLRGALKEIYKNLGSKLLLRDGLDAYRKVMVGFFWILHEEPNFPSELYDMNDLNAVLKVITPAPNNDLDDPLQTSPLTGKTEMTDEDIIRYALKQTPSAALDDIESINVTRSPRFIDVTTRFRNGEKTEESFPTLYSEWEDVSDDLGLLEFGGTKIEKPDLTRVEAPRSVALATLKKVNEEMRALVKHFIEVATFFANYDPQGQGNSLGNRYFNQHRKLEEKAKKDLGVENLAAKAEALVPSTLSSDPIPVGRIEVMPGDTWVFEGEGYDALTRGQQLRVINIGNITITIDPLTPKFVISSQ
jgi:hypothetical protein